MTEISTDIESALKFLYMDELIAIPTETVYGLAANAFSEDAVKKIFELKQRPIFNPLIVHIGSIDDLDKIAKNIPDVAWKLAEAFWPGPLTLLLEKKDIIPDIVTAGSERVAVRIPNHKLTLDLLSKLTFPVAAPSANPFMSISPTKAIHVMNYFEGKLKFILEGGNCEKGIESTIIGFEDKDAVIYRSGSCDVVEIEKIVGKLILPKQKTLNPQAPGMLKRHYAPKTRFIVTTNYKKEMQKHANKKIGVMLLNSDCVNSENTFFKSLSQNENLDEAASNLYTTLIELDAMNLDIIIASYVPNKGIGKSINDRLQRAATL